MPKSAHSAEKHLLTEAKDFLKHPGPRTLKKHRKPPKERQPYDPKLVKIAKEKLKREREEAKKPRAATTKKTVKSKKRSAKKQTEERYKKRGKKGV